MNYELNPVTMGKRLRELRGDKPTSVVATALQISESALNMYENGNRIPRDEVKIRIANYYKKPIQSIFFVP